VLGIAQEPRSMRNSEGRRGPGVQVGAEVGVVGRPVVAFLVVVATRALRWRPG
jgi:hypothetical protein